MNTFHKYVASTATSLIWTLAMSAPLPASAETRKAENAQALLDEAKTTALERKIATKQTELDRLAEDLHKAKLQADGLEKSIEKVTAAIAESNGHLDQLASQKKRLLEILEIVTLRSDAERTKVEGLKMLANAQKKSLDAIAKCNDETELKSGIARVEMGLLSPKELQIIGAAEGPDSATGKRGNATEMRRKLGKVSYAASAANTSAREALTAASAKIQQADAAGAKASARGSELGIEEIPNLPHRNADSDLSATLPKGDAAPATDGTTAKKRSKH
jgi:chromosome segregation ATPase